MGRKSKFQELKERTEQEIGMKTSLKDLTSIEMNDFLTTRCKELPSDAERKTFELSKKTVIRIAISEAGIQKNLKEIKLLIKYKNSGIIPELRQYSKNGEWYMLERCQPVSEAMAKLQLADIEQTLLFDTQNIKIKPFNYEVVSRKPFYQKLLWLVQNGHFGVWDVLDKENWAKNIEGDLVLTELGCETSEDVKNMFAEFQEKINHQ